MPKAHNIQLQNAITRLKAMNKDLEESITFFEAPDAWFTKKNGPTAKVVMIAKWQNIVVSNSRIIAEYEEEIAKGT